MDKAALRRTLIEERLNLPDRLQRADLLQQVMRIWLVNRPDTVIGAYWPIKGEFDPLPALHRWKEDGELLDEPLRRRIGLPVVNKQHKTLTFHAWYPGCPMEEDAYGIPKPKDTEVIVPTLLFVPCVGYAPGGYRWAMAAAFTTARWRRCSPSRSRWPGLHPWLPGRLRARGVRPATRRHPERQRRGLAHLIPGQADLHDGL